MPSIKRIEKGGKISGLPAGKYGAAFTDMAIDKGISNKEGGDSRGKGGKMKTGKMSYKTSNSGY